ncbi:hypothetical protein [Sphingosinicella sp. BN140058]|uniref:hypothetical protein n=1 Tax=Sphingosinicella sp. BN140058 TaxID=1892855 RepID=UPI0010102C0D|nr:hypothetical protein [Sphingosinicella sp. BN140058]QAY76815.1 hypothetical protein ETR14_10125 [Sphingosinicella sp. BN140058]
MPWNPTVVMVAAMFRRLAKVPRLFALLAGALMLAAAAPPLTFVPVESHYATAAAEYEAIWRADGARIVAALEGTSGLVFPEQPIEVMVSDGRPFAYYNSNRIRLRAGYSPAYKKATLMHELGHRLSFQLLGLDGIDDHRLLYLFLHDAWAQVYGPEFADRMSAIERRLPGSYDADWGWALSLSREERQAELKARRDKRP